MNQQQDQQQQVEAGGHEPQPTAGEADPGELARRELIEWCERHELPVPVERRDQRQ